MPGTGGGRGGRSDLHADNGVVGNSVTQGSGTLLGAGVGAFVHGSRRSHWPFNLHPVRTQFPSVC